MVSSGATAVIVIRERGSPTLRIKARYQSLSILPLSQYSDLAQYLRCNAVSLCHILEQEINVKAKEEVATCLVKILQCLGTAKDS
ncbi:putative disabled-like 2-interacting protein [Apostichopus japonicus]|uniref:Putative disabled-like 2-interacting protein n=1 Tax=Stichopus japonicus TaxID=307972 RepID=A0A2G8JN64_STIJA|nr:putative disabled-like 2-interacting protein [Apostichopus japonicus]